MRNYAQKSQGAFDGLSVFDRTLSLCQRLAKHSSQRIFHCQQRYLFQTIKTINSTVCFLKVLRIHAANGSLIPFLESIIIIRNMSAVSEAIYQSDKHTLM